MVNERITVPIWLNFNVLAWVLILYFAYPISLQFETAIQTVKGIAILIIISMGLYILFITTWIMRGKVFTNRSTKKTFFAFIGSTLFCAIVWSYYLVVYYPGLISWDFYVQWHEMAGNTPFTDWHPFFHTLVIWAVTRIWFSPAMVSIAQIFFMSLVVGLLASKVRKFDMPLILIVMLVCFYALFPLNGFYAVSLWKDIGYSIAIFWCTVLTLEIVHHKGGILQKPLFLIQFFLSLVCIALMRHNGLVPAFGVLLILFLFYWRHQFWKILTLAIMLVTVIALYRGPLFSLLNVDVKNRNILAAHLPIQHIGAILSDDGIVTSEEKEFLTNILPISYWQRSYNPRSCMPLIFGKDKEGRRMLNVPFLEDRANYEQFLHLWSKLVIRNPTQIIKYHISASELLWLIHAKYGVFIIADEDITEQHLYDGYTPSTRLIERVNDAGKRLIELLTNPSTGWFLHRGALYFLLALLGLNLALIRTRNWEPIIVATPMLLQAVTIALFPLVQDTRFMFPIILVAPVLVALVFVQSLVYDKDAIYGSLEK
jgi:hypothetical protein